MGKMNLIARALFLTSATDTDLKRALPNNKRMSLKNELSEALSYLVLKRLMLISQRQPERMNKILRDKATMSQYASEEMKDLVEELSGLYNEVLREFSYEDVVDEITEKLKVLMRRPT